MMASPPAPYCLHAEDAANHKCTQSCAATEFAIKGESETGACPKKYNTVDRTVTAQQCPDGVTQLRYCPGKAVTVTTLTKGEDTAVKTAMMMASPPAPYCLH